MSKNECSGESDDCQIQDTESLTFDNASKVLTFDCDKVIVKDKSLETQWSGGCLINLKEFETIIFSVNGEKYTYKKV